MLEGKVLTNSSMLVLDFISTNLTTDYKESLCLLTDSYSPSLRVPSREKIASGIPESEIHCTLSNGRGYLLDTLLHRPRLASFRCRCQCVMSICCKPSLASRHPPFKVFISDKGKWKQLQSSTLRKKNVTHSHKKVAQLSHILLIIFFVLPQTEGVTREKALVIERVFLDSLSAAFHLIPNCSLLF
jgi:hypothetical protein